MIRINNLTEQQKDWFALKGLCILARNTEGEQRSESLQKLYLGLREYKSNYKTKFNYQVTPQ